MKITPFVIEKFAAFLANGRVFAAMKNIVLDLESSSLPNNEKRQSAVDQFKAIGYEVGGWVINLLLELAVAWARSSTK